MHMSIAPYKNIIFDFGGVILSDSFQDLIEQEFKGEQEIPLYLVNLHDLPLWKAWNKGLLTRQQVIEEASLKYGHEVVARLINFFLNPGRRFIQESIDALYHLKTRGYRLYMLSNMSKDVYETFVVPHPEIFSQFDGMCLSFQIGMVKPEPEIYEYFLKHYKLNPLECVFIDDRHANLDAAQKFGIATIHYIAGELGQKLIELGIKLYVP